MPINKKDYPANWTEIRERILLRAGHCCERCGVEEYTVGHRVGSEGELYPIIVGKNYREANALRKRMEKVMERRLIVIRITISHLDHDEWNHNVTDERLAALCERCHFHYDEKDNQLRKRYGKQYKRFQAKLF